MAELFTAFILPFACGIAAAMPFVLLIRWFLNNRAAQRQALQAQILLDRPDLAGARAFPVNYATEDYFWQWMKPVSWQGSGQLAIKHDGARYVGRVAGQDVEIPFPRTGSHVKWVGMAMRNGRAYWLELETGGGRHYFTAETGAFARDSARATRQVYDELVRVFNPADRESGENPIPR